MTFGLSSKRPSPRSRGGDYQSDSSDWSIFDRVGWCRFAHEFARRAAITKSVPDFWSCPFRNALRVAMDEAPVNQLRSERGWKLFMLLLQTLVVQTTKRWHCPQVQVSWKIPRFHRAGGCIGRHCAEDASRAQCRKRRKHQEDDLERRAGRALSLVQMGELSAGRQALEDTPVAPGNR